MTDALETGPPLRLASWEEICDELSRRFPSWALLRKRESSKKDDTVTDFLIAYDGGFNEAYGMMKRAMFSFEDRIKRMDGHPWADEEVAGGED